MGCGSNSAVTSNPTTRRSPPLRYAKPSRRAASPACTWTPPPSTWKCSPTTAHPADRAATSTSGSGLPHPLPANPCAAMSPWTSPGSTSPTYPHRSGSPYAAASTAPRSTCTPRSSWRQRPSHTPARGITAGRSLSGAHDPRAGWSVVFPLGSPVSHGAARCSERCHRVRGRRSDARPRTLYTVGARSRSRAVARLRTPHQRW